MHTHQGSGSVKFLYLDLLDTVPLEIISIYKMLRRHRDISQGKGIFCKCVYISLFIITNLYWSPNLLSSSNLISLWLQYGRNPPPATTNLIRNFKLQVVPCNMFLHARCPCAQKILNTKIIETRKTLLFNLTDPNPWHTHTHRIEEWINWKSMVLINEPSMT